MNTKIFCDIADISTIKKFNKKIIVKGFTTNPSLIRKAGAKDYKSYSKRILKVCKNKPVSFEVFADEKAAMIRQAKQLASWGDNVYVKIPVTNTHGESMTSVIKELHSTGIKVNITAVMTDEQVRDVRLALTSGVPAVISIFAGRIADAGIDPLPIMQRAADALDDMEATELLWASPREILNVIQAQASGCDIITMTADLWRKLDLLGKPLAQYSLETVQMFYSDAQHAGFDLEA